MSTRTNRPLKESEKALCNEVGKKAARRQRAIQQEGWSVWHGLGMFGIIGWSVAIPTILGVALGLWLDKQWPLGFSWTLTLLLGGLVMGCVNAWFWLSRQSEAMNGGAPDDGNAATSGKDASRGG